MYKYKIFYDKIVSLLIQKEFEVDYLKDITNQDLSEILKNYLTPAVVYDAFCVILLKTARDSLFSNSKNQFNDVNMSVLKHQVIYRIYRHITLISISHGVTYKVIQYSKIAPLDTLIRSIRNIMTHEHVSISSTNEYTSHLSMESTDYLTVFPNQGCFLGKLQRD